MGAKPVFLLFQPKWLFSPYNFVAPPLKVVQVVGVHNSILRKLSFWNQIVQNVSLGNIRFKILKKALF